MRITKMNASELNDNMFLVSKSNIEDGIFFTIRDTECNSKIFGDCEICEKPVVQVHHQIRWKETFHPILNVPSKKQISDSYGHHQCLLSVR